MLDEHRRDLGGGRQLVLELHAGEAAMVGPAHEGANFLDVDQEGQVAALAGEPPFARNLAIADEADNFLAGAAALLCGIGDVRLAGSGHLHGLGAVEQLVEEGVQVLGRELVGGSVVHPADPRDDQAGPVEHVSLHSGRVEVFTGPCGPRGWRPPPLSQPGSRARHRTGNSRREAVRVCRQRSCRPQELPQALGVQAGLGRQRPDRMQCPALDGLAEHDVAGPHRKPCPDEVPDEIADSVVARVLPPVFQRLVDAPEDGLGSFGGGAGIGIGFPQAFQEFGHAGFATGEDLEAGAAGGVPLLIGEPLEIRGSPERRDRAEPFARADRDVQRQPVEQLRAVVGVQAANDVGLEPGDGALDGLGRQAVEIGNDASDVVGEVVEFAGREVADNDRERDAVDGAGLDGGDLPDGASEWWLGMALLAEADVPWYGVLDLRDQGSVRVFEAEVRRRI